MMAIVLSAAGLMLTVMTALIKVTWNAAREIRSLRDVIADLKVELATQRSNDRDWVRDLMDARFREHVADCPAREPTGVHAHPSGRWPRTGI